MGRLGASSGGSHMGELGRVVQGWRGERGHGPTEQRSKASGRRCRCATSAAVTLVSQGASSGRRHTGPAAVRGVVGFQLAMVAS